MEMNILYKQVDTNDTGRTRDSSCADKKELGFIRGILLGLSCEARNPVFLFVTLNVSPLVELLVPRCATSFVRFLSLIVISGIF